MESIKHKMECLQREAVEAQQTKQKLLDEEEAFRIKVRKSKSLMVVQLNH